MNKYRICLIGALLAIAADSGAVTLSYPNVDPNGILDTTVGGVPARLIQVTGDELLLAAGGDYTLQISFAGGRSLRVAPAGVPPGTELINLALLSPQINGSGPTDTLSGTVTVIASGDYLPGSGVTNGFDQAFVPNSPFAGVDVILLRQIGNITDSGYDLRALEYEITVPAGFADFPVSGINLLVSGSAFAAVPLPAGLPLMLSGLLVGIRLMKAMPRLQA